MTSPFELIRVECPNCHTTFEDCYRPSINLSLGEDWTEEEIDEAMTVSCPKCGQRHDIDSLVVNYVYEQYRGDGRRFDEV